MDQVKSIFTKAVDATVKNPFYHGLLYGFIGLLMSLVIAYGQGCGRLSADGEELSLGEFLSEATEEVGDYLGSVLLGRPKRRAKAKRQVSAKAKKTNSITLITFGALWFVACVGTGSYFQYRLMTSSSSASSYARYSSNPSPPSYSPYRPAMSSLTGRTMNASTASSYKPYSSTSSYRPYSSTTTGTSSYRPYSSTSAGTSSYRPYSSTATGTSSYRPYSSTATGASSSYRPYSSTSAGTSSYRPRTTY